RALTAQEFESLAKQKNLILDTRPADQYGTGHIPGSLNIGLGGQFATWAGSLIPLGTPILLVAESEERVLEARMRLARVGHENVIGYLDGGLLAWHQAGKPLATTEQITVDELERRIKEHAVDQVIDVRRPGEWNSGHIKVAAHFPLNHLAAESPKLNRQNSIAAICAGGYRSSTATSILEQQGFTRVTNVIGGMSAWQNAKLETVT